MNQWRFRCLLLLVSITHGFVMPAYAEDCDNFLASLALQTPSEGVSPDVDLTLSPAAKAYLRLIEHLLLKNDSSLDLPSRLSLAIESNHPVNPLGGSSSPTEIQYSQIIDKLILQISKDWGAVKDRLSLLLKSNEVEATGRKNNENETSKVFVQETVQRLPTAQAVVSSPAWQVVGDKVYLVVGSLEGHVHLYEWSQKTGQMVERGKYKVDNWIYSSPSWLVFEGQVYMAIGTSDHHLYLFELEQATGLLTEKGKYKTDGAILSSPAWQVVGGRAFVAVGSTDRNLYLYRLNQELGLLEERGKYKAGEKINSSPAWQVAGKKTFLAIGSNDNHLHLYELNQTSESLEERGKYRTGGQIKSSPAWQVVGGQIFLAIGSNDKHLYLYRLNPSKGKLRGIGKYNAIAEVRSTPAWQVVGDQIFLAVVSFDNYLHLYKFNKTTNELEARDKYKTSTVERTSKILSSARWKVVEGRAILAVGSVDDHLYLFELNLITGLLEQIGWLMADKEIFSSPGWQVIGDEVYLAVGSNDKKLYLYKIFKSLNRSGDL